MNKIKLTLSALMMTLVGLNAAADYVVHSVTGNVTRETRAGKVAVKKGDKLSPKDDIVIASGSRVEIFNTVSKEISGSSRIGTSSVMDIVLRADSKQNDTFGQIQKRVRFGGAAKTNARQYTEGSVTRSFESYDPSGAAFSLNAKEIAAHIVYGKQQEYRDLAPVAGCTFSPVGEGGLQFKMVNTFDFPIYLNVVKYKDGFQDAAISELGQPTGCYVLLPGQSILREHTRSLAPETQHLLVMAHCKFDIDELLSVLPDVAGSAALTPHDSDTQIYLQPLK